MGSLTSCLLGELSVLCLALTVSSALRKGMDADEKTNVLKDASEVGKEAHTSKHETTLGAFFILWLDSPHHMEKYI